MSLILREVLQRGQGSQNVMPLFEDTVPQEVKYQRKCNIFYNYHEKYSLQSLYFKCLYMLYVEL